MLMRTVRLLKPAAPSAAPDGIQ